MYNMKELYDLISEARRRKEAPLPNSIEFDTIKEAENFWHSYRDLKFFYVLCDITIQQQHIQLDRLPFLDSYKKRLLINKCMVYLILMMLNSIY